LTTNHPRVPVDARNTVWKMVEKCLAKMGIGAEVSVHIEKNLPVQGGMGAGSANAAAALIGLERELGVALPGVERLRLAAEVGSDAFVSVGWGGFGAWAGGACYADAGFSQDLVCGCGATGGGFDSRGVQGLGCARGGECLRG